MLAPSPMDHQLTLPMIEGGLTLIAIAAAFCWPRLAAAFFSGIESRFRQLAQRKGLAVVTTGVSALLMRLAILPFCPIPLPFVPDDFSFLLAADTFAHGRLTNPTPAMWMHFESLHINMHPTYMSMYFPSNGLLLAAGKVFFGNPWYGLLICSALMSAAICWMLQAWLPSTWALLGGFISIVHLGLFSYWINTYTGGGVICALGGALILGSLPRLKKTARFRYGMLMALGIALLLLTRPYEGMLLCIPVAISLGRWAVAGANRPRPQVLFRRAVLPLALVIGAGAWLGYYDARNYGKATTLPYTVNRTTYAMAPYFVWQAARQEPEYHHASMRRFYYESELEVFNKVHSIRRFVPMSLLKILETLLFYAGFALMIPLMMVQRIFRDRRIRFLLLCVAVLVAGMTIQIYLIPHYLAAFTALFYAIGLQCMRHLRVWSPGKQPVGKTLVRLAVTICVVMTVLRIGADPLKIQITEWPASKWSAWWYGPNHFGTERAQIASRLEALPGKQLVIVRSSNRRYVLDEWVYNSANIDGSKVIWAREMDAPHNEEVLHYYRDRQAWLLDTDTWPARVTRYPDANREVATVR